jgi:Transposase and inactivated derivatives
VSPFTLLIRTSLANPVQYSKRCETGSCCFQSSVSADEDILKKSMDSRRLMRNAELGLKIDYHDVQGGSFTRRCTVYFDGEICRVDTQRNNEDGTDDFRVVDVMNGENRIWYTTMTSGPGSRVASWVKDLTESAERESSILPHPWYLGLAACEWERLIHFQPELCVTGRGNAGDETEVSSGDYKKMNSWIVTRTGKSRGPCITWIGKRVAYRFERKEFCSCHAHGRLIWSATLSDAQWDRIKHLIPELLSQPKGGRPPDSQRACLEGILFVLLTGCQWEKLPKCFPSPSPAGDDSMNGLASASLRDSGIRCSWNWKTCRELTRKKPLRMPGSSGQQKGGPDWKDQVW